MKFGLKQKEYDFLKEAIIPPIEQIGGSVWCFGSRSRGDHQKFSDIDLLVECSEKGVRQLINSISEKLEYSNFPLIVDIVLLDDLANSYKKKVLSERKLL